MGIPPPYWTRDSALIQFIEAAGEHLLKLETLSLDENVIHRVSPSMVKILKLPCLKEIRVSSAQVKPAFEALRVSAPFHDDWTTLSAVMRKNRAVYDKVVYQP